jgi:hypothetical protein
MKASILLKALGVFALGLLSATSILAQANAVDLGGSITDPQNAAVAGAKITVRNLATNATRSVQSNEAGRYIVVNLPPGSYELTVEKAGFAKAVNPELVLEIGRAAELNVQLKIQAGAETVTVTESTELVETRRTAVSETVESRQINNLPINGRNYVNFTLINSQANRDSAPSIGAAPTSGLNFGGQRARSNEVSVDGADAVDNSVNGIRSTVSQEGVQEFQLIISNYMPEFGRASGGVINIVTKSGTNAFHGDAFGFLRAKDLQARNPFSVQVDPVTGAVTPVKQSYTRAQYGTAFGGPIRKDKTFYFFSFEGTRRQETGFTNIGQNSSPTALGNFDGACTNPAGCVTPGGTVPFGLTVDQATALASFPVAAQMAYVAAAASASAVARTGINPGLIPGVAPPGSPFFPLPVPCAPGSLAPALCGATGLGLAPLPASFVPLNNLIGNYPIEEKTDLYSARIDQIWNAKNSTFVRGNVSPSLQTGIQVNAQNQNFGQNAGTRTSLNQYRDWAIVAQHTTTFSSNLLNEFRFQAARRGLHYGFSTLPGGDQVAVNMTGFAFFGREPFSTVDRIERRFQWTDNVSYVMGKHTLKFGGDFNLIQLRSKKTQIFELNFGGIFNFGSISADAVVDGLLAAIGQPPVVGLPAFTAVQAYGLGLPQNFIQGVGNSNSPFDNKAFGVYAQDSWRILPKVTFNYGLRYDIEFTPTFAPFNATNAAAENALGVLEGIPVYHTALQPRFALAYDPWGNGKTVIRAGAGIFYDHPLLAVAFDSTTADGARSSQLIAAGGAASACGIFPSSVVAVCGGTADSPANLNAGSLFQGVLNTTAPGGFPFTIPYIGGTTNPLTGVNTGGQQRFDAKDPNSVFINENYIAAGFPTPILPFTLPVAKSFQYGYATQANLTIERELGRDFKISVGYQYTKGTHLNRPRNVNTSNPVLMVNNFRNALVSGLTPGNPVTVIAPVANVPATAGTCGINVIQPQVLGVLTGCPGPLSGLTGQFVSTAAVFNFFRPSGPNPAFAGPGAVAYPSLVALAAAAGYPQGYFSSSGAPIVTPFSDVLQQESSGNSTYNGLTVNVEKRFSRHYQFLASYTYSHAIDDSTDLQTLLAPQDNNNPQLERGNSTFDQRHRFVLSGVAESPYKWSDGGWKRVFADWVFAPIFEASTGRPFTVLTGTDYNLDFGSNTDRPSVIPQGAPVPPGLPTATSQFISGVTFTIPTNCPVTIAGIAPPLGCTGNLARNPYYRPNYVSLDMRLARKFKITERFSFEVIADMFNLLNRFNVADVNPLCDPLAPPCTAGQPTSSFDPRTFQFGLKLYW